MVPLRLQRMRLGEVQLDREDRDEARGQLGVAAGSRLVERGALDLARLEDLEDVALPQVVEALEQDAALEALRDLADVVLEAAQRGDGRLVDARALAEDADVRAAAHETARDHAAGDRPQARDLEEREHLDLADDRFGLDRREHADERLLDLLGQPVDDAVEADLDAGALGDGAHLGRRADVEADHHRARGGGKVDVVLGDSADARVDDVDADLRVLDLAELGDDRLDGALDVALDHDVQVLHRTGLHLAEERLERDAAGRLLGVGLAAQPLAALVCEVAGGRRTVEAEDLDGLAGARLVDSLAAVIEQRAHTAPRVAGDDRVSDLERAAVDEHRRDGA